MPYKNKNTINILLIQATKNPFYLHVGMDILQSLEKNTKVKWVHILVTSLSFLVSFKAGSLPEVASGVALLCVCSAFFLHDVYLGHQLMCVLCAKGVLRHSFSVLVTSPNRCGYATLHHVVDKSKEDRMESFFLSETCKYLYLVSAQPQIQMSKFKDPLLHLIC